MIEKMNLHYSFTTPASIHDEEALTALELAGRQGAKINEIVDDQNAHRSEVSKSINDQNKTIDNAINTQNENISKIKNDTVPAEVKKEVKKQIDDGTFDSQINNYMNNLNSRLDNLLDNVPEGGTTSDAELIDIRAGAFGASYNNAGNSVREQVKEALKLATEGIKLTFTLGTISDTGVISNGDSEYGNYYSNIIPASLFNKILYERKTNCQFTVARYNNGVFVSRDKWTQHVNTVGPVVIDNTNDVRIIIASNVSGEHVPVDDLLKRCNLTIIPTYQPTADIKKVINETVFLNKSIEWQEGGVNSEGLFTKPTGTNNSHITPIITKDKFKTLYVKGNERTWVNYVLYDDDFKFIERGEWNKGEEWFMINNYNIRLIIANDPLRDIVDWNTMLNSVTIEFRTGLEKSTPEPSAGVGNSEFLAHVMNCDTPYKIAHFSIDDVQYFMNDLCSGEYSSIYDHEFFMSLDNLHGLTGCTITLNVFNENLDIGYDILNLPYTFQYEFQDIKSWLKFGFHGKNASSNYNTHSGIIEDYEKFVQGIYRLTGDYDCIDRIVRLGWFGGNLENVKAIKELSYGIIGLLTADDNRLSYYLNEEQNNICINKGKYFDVENELILIKSQKRFDTYSAWEVQEEFEKNLPQQKFCEFFIHEGNDLNEVTDFAIFLQSNNWRFSFPSDIFKR